MKAGIFATCMLVPVIILVVALIAKANPKSEINSTFGYRTKKSMASQENWDKAQELMAKYLLIISVVMIAVSLVCAFFIATRLSQVQMIIGLSILMLVQALGILVVIPLVESQLK